MGIEPHIEQLEERHRQLKSQLEELRTHPSASEMDIADIKRQKLHIKDRIAQLRSETSVQ